MRIDLPHPLAGTVPQVGAPLRFSAHAARRTMRAPPLLGEHTRDVLRERRSASATPRSPTSSSAASSACPPWMRRESRHAAQRWKSGMTGIARPVILDRSTRSRRRLRSSSPWRLFPLAIPIVNLDIKISRDEAIAAARERSRRACSSRPDGAHESPRASRTMRRRRTTSSSKAAASARSRRCRRATAMRRTGGKCGCSRSASIDETIVRLEARRRRGRIRAPASRGLRARRGDARRSIAAAARALAETQRPNRLGRRFRDAIACSSSRSRRRHPVASTTASCTSAPEPIGDARIRLTLVVAGDELTGSRRSSTCPSRSSAATRSCAARTT